MPDIMFDPEIRDIIIRKADENELDAAALLAIISVESAGRVFAKVDGKLEPLIRFEGHYFYRLLPKAKRNIAVTQGLAHRRAGHIKNSRFQKSRWRFLNKCIALDRDSALQSTSWGVGQVMGSHWRWLGYASVDAMISDVRRGVGGQVELIIRFIKKANLVRFLDAQDWAGFARSYNGAGYKQNKYDLKMAKAYKSYVGLVNENNIVNLGVKKTNRHAFATLRLGDVGEAVGALQSDLRSCGYLLSVDGDFGPVTRRAVIAFQKLHGLDVDGIVGPRTYEVIGRLLPQPANLLNV
ncbi:MAG: DUF3380 domain-containing protein [Rhizobiales bacterium]|nr:DUF3380 domain-containing protein [Hyphomicrobiales bacterium]